MRPLLKSTVALSLSLLTQCGPRSPELGDLTKGVPSILVSCENLPSARTDIGVILAVWPDGTILWSADDRFGGSPYRVGEVTDDVYARCATQLLLRSVLFQRQQTTRVSELAVSSH